MVILLSMLVLSVTIGTLPSSAKSNSSANNLQDWQNKVEPGVLTAASAGEAQFLIHLNQQADLSH